MKRKIAALLSGVLLSSAVIVGVDGTAVTTFAAPKVNPYGTVQAEFNFGRSGVETKTEGDVTYLTSFEQDDYILVKDVDFSEGVSKMFINGRTTGAALVAVKIDSLDGDPIGLIRLGNTKGEFKQFSSGDLKEVTGKHDVYFVGMLGDIDFDYWTSVKAEGEQPDPVNPDPVNPDPVQPESLNPYETVQAEAGAAVNAEATTEGDVTYIKGLKSGSLISYQNVEFDGVDTITLTYRTNGAAIVEVREGGIAGTLLANLKLSNTKGEFVTKEFKVTNQITGKKNISILGKMGEIDLDSWKANKANQEPDPVNPDPVNPDPVQPDSYNPYETVQAEAGAPVNATAATEGDVTYIKGLKSGSLISYQNVEFDGVDTITLTYRTNSASIVEIREGGIAGTLLANLKLANTNGQFVTKDFKVTNEITGKKNISILGKMGEVDLDSWKANKAVVTPDPDPIDPYVAGGVQAESGRVVNADVETEGDVSFVKGLKKGSLVSFKNVQFHGTNKMMIVYRSNGASSLEVREGSIGGKVIGSVKLSDTQGKFVLKSFDLENVEGAKDITILGTFGEVDLDTWAVSDGTFTPDPDLPESYNPYETVEAETGAVVNAEASKEGETAFVKGIKSGSTVTFRNVQFDGSDSLTLTYRTDSAAVIELRLGGSEGELLTNVKLTNTQGQFVTKTVKIPSLTGAKDVAVVGRVVSVDLDSWIVTKPADQPDPVDPDPVDPTPSPVNPYNLVEAEAGALTGVATSTEGNVTYAAGVKKGSAITYKDVEFDGVDTITLTYRTNGAAIVEFREGSADGAVLANLKLSGTNGQFVTKDFKVTKSFSGKKDVAIVAKMGEFDLDSWKANKANQEPDPDPVNPDPTPVNPYETVQAEAGSPVNAAAATEGNVTYIKGLKSGSLIEYKDVTFDGVDTFTLTYRTNGAAIIEVREGGIAGTLLANIKLSNTKGEFVTKDFKVTNEITGKKNIAIVGKMGEVDLDSWKANKAQNPDPVEPDPVSPYNTVQAENGTLIRVSTATEGGVTYVAGIQSGSLVSFQKVQFDGSKSIALTYRANSAAVVEVRAGGVAGQLLATIELPATDGQFVTKSFDFADVTGEKNISILGKSGQFDLDAWSVSKEAVVNPDPDPDPVDPDPVDPDPVDPDPVNPSDATFTYQINSWGTGYVVNFAVVNNTNENIDGWKVKISKKDVKIDSSWCVNIEEDGDYYIVTPLDWNYRIYPNNSAQFGIIGSGSIGDSIEYILE